MKISGFLLAMFLSTASILLMVPGMGCASPETATPAPASPSPTTPAPTPSGQTINLTANNLAFDREEISVPAGVHVTIVFNNQEPVPHNFALYETPAATNAIFTGDIITGPRTIEYTFITPDSPGTYFFRCDVHPVAMNGDFIVTE